MRTYSRNFSISLEFYVKLAIIKMIILRKEQHCFWKKIVFFSNFSNSEQKLSEIWQNTFDRDVKTAFCMSKGTFWGKIFFLKFFLIIFGLSAFGPPYNQSGKDIISIIATLSNFPKKFKVSVEKTHIFLQKRAEFRTFWGILQFQSRSTANLLPFGWKKIHVPKRERKSFLAWTQLANNGLKKRSNWEEDFALTL